LDDHKNPASDSQFWSFILTGADFNREIKLWSCSNWECLQTIRFLAPVYDDLPTLTGSGSSINSGSLTSGNSIVVTKPVLKTAIDLSSTYLLMSDITRKCFYVLHLTQDANEARCTAISEFILGIF
jgi:hypothetical protein